MTRTRAPDPPRGFRGTFTTDDDVRDAFAVASGPFRIRPRAVARPVDVEDLSVLVRWAASEGQPLVPRGSGTGMPGGNIGSGISVDLAPWQRMEPLDERAGRVRVQPGVVADRVQEAAAGSGYFVPYAPSSSDRASIGGMVANNAAGARTFRYGATRSWVEALEIVGPDGVVTRLRRGMAPTPSFIELRDGLVAGLGAPPRRWPAVRKNASGYALDAFLADGDPISLFVGSEGTLGFVTEIDLRLAPLPEERILALVPVPELDVLATAVEAGREVGASACEFFGRRFIEIAGLDADARTEGLCREVEALLLVEMDGSVEDTRRAADDLRRRVRSFAPTIREVREEEGRAELWRIRHAASPVIAAQAVRGLVSMQFIEDSVVPPSALGGYLEGLSEILAAEETDGVVFGHAGDGNVHVNPLIDVRRPEWRARVGRILEGTVDLVAKLGGTLSGEHGDGRLRGTFHDRVWGTELANAFRTVKAHLDPSGIMNPGVIVPLPGQDPLEAISPLGGRR